jgi:hypothetical protein
MLFISAHIKAVKNKTQEKLDNDNADGNFSIPFEA